MAAGAVLFCNLGGARLWDDDEPRNATCAREMLGRGDWIVPTFNQKLRTDKPILIYWLMMTAYQTLGDNEFSARVVSATLALGTSLLTYHIGRLLFRAEVGLWAGLILCTAIFFDMSGRAATTDSLLLFCITLAILAFVHGVRSSNTLPSAHENASRRFADLVPRRWLSFAAMYAAMGLAVLAKGPVGLVLPVAALGMYLLIVGDERRRDLWHAGQSTTRKQQLLNWFKKLPVNFIHATWQLRPLTLLVVVAVVALPWYVAVSLRTDGQWTRDFIGNHNLGRFADVKEGHRGPFFYYMPVIMIGFFPWSILLPASITTLVLRIRQRHLWRPAYVLVACWMCVVIVAFSCAATKLPTYVLPAYPAIALIAASFADRWIREPATAKKWLRVALPTLGLVGVGLMIALPIISRRILPGEAWLGLIGLAPFTGALLALWFSERHQAQRAMVTLCVTAIVFGVGIWGIGAARVSVHQNSESMVAAAQQISPAGQQFAAFRYGSPSLVYYAHNHVDYFDSPQQVADFLAADAGHFVVVSAERLEEIKSALPPGVEPLVHRPRFARTAEELLLLGRTPQTAFNANKTSVH